MGYPLNVRTIIPSSTITRWARPAATALRGASLGSIGLCIGLWIRAKTVDQTARGNAERRALFVGLWPPMFWLIADSVADEGRRRSE